MEKSEEQLTVTMTILYIVKCAIMYNDIILLCAMYMYSAAR